MANRDTVKPWFQTGKKPTQAQFYQLFDWLFFSDDGIAMNAVAGLVATLNGKADQASFNSFYQGELINASANVIYNQLANYLIEKIIIIPGADALVRIGTTNGGEEVMPETQLLAADAGTYVQVLDAFAVANRNLYINGITAGTRIIILKRLLKTI